MDNQKTNSTDQKHGPGQKAEASINESRPPHPNPLTAIREQWQDDQLAKLRSHLRVIAQGPARINNSPSMPSGPNSDVKSASWQSPFSGPENQTAQKNQESEESLISIHEDPEVVLLSERLHS